MRIQVIDTIQSQARPLKRVAGYARVSIDSESAANSLKVQSDFLKRRIQQHSGWVDCGIFIDYAYSGTKTQRPGFQALIEKCRRKEVDLVITKSISRFCRNTVDLLSTVRELKDLNVEVFFDENGISTFSNEGELLITLLASQAQEESRSISENILWAFSKKFERGEGLPSNMLGVRWDGEKYKVIPKEADAVRRIFDFYLAGFGPKAIARKMNADGVRGINGKPLTEQTVGTILRQEKYTGNSILQKTFTENHISHRKILNRGEKDRFWVEDTHPMIVPKEVFEDVQAEIERRKSMDSLASNWKVNTSIFTSRIICVDCGRTFRRKVNKRKKYPPYYLWVCGEKFDKRNGGCKSKGIPEWFLYETAAEIIGKDEFSDDEFYSTIDHIIAGKEHEATFVLTDGREITKTWRNRRWQEK